MFFKSPLSQFDIITIFPMIFGNIDISITNLTLSLFLAVSIGVILFYILYSDKLVPKIWQLMLESIFLFVFRLVHQQVGKNGLIYFPFIFSLFGFILILNLLSMTPFGFAATSHMVWTIYFSLSICLGIFFLGILKHQIHFLKLFVPEVPFFLYPLMISIEILSYIIRSFSLAIRLSANLIAGHTLVHILADFIGYLCVTKNLLFVIPFILLLAIFMLEFGVACLQAYIFVTLVSMYLNEAITLGGNH